MSHCHRLIPQIVVTLNIKDDHWPPVIEYTYVEPTDPENPILPPILPPKPFPHNHCSLRAPAPYYAIYALDYASTKAGWYFKKHIIFNGRSKKLLYYRDANRLSMTTLYEAPDSGEYSFNLQFKNMLTGASWNTDPQESNSTPPCDDDNPTTGE